MPFKDSKAAGTGSSPPSSDQATYCGGSPSTNTNLTTPLAGHHHLGNEESRLNRGLHVDVPNSYTLFRNLNLDTTSNRDVFLHVPDRSNTSSHLSPTATTFTPSTPQVFDYPPQPRVLYKLNSNNTHRTGFYPNGNVNGGDHGYPSGPLPGVIGEQGSGTVESRQLSSASPVPNNVATMSNMMISEGSFSTDEGLTRAFVVDRVPKRYPWHTLASTFNASTFKSLETIDISNIMSHGTFYTSYSDVRDAVNAMALVERLEPGWIIQKLTPKQLALEKGYYDSGMVSNFQGQVILSFIYDRHPAASPIPAESVLDMIKHITNMFGKLKAIESVAPRAATPGLRQFRMEFCDARAAEHAIQAVNGATISGVVVGIERFEPDVVNNRLSSPNPSSTHLSLTGRSRLASDQVEDYERQIMRISLDDPIKTRRHATNGPHNQVYISRIERGTDVRTTIMLRNIPNKIDFNTLKEYIDETSFGCYDFLYLRIDFSNNCNVGYAFINFVDPLSIVPFATARAGQRWDEFNSDKIAEISYATIQGRDCLIQKFRNSSVMLECPSYRPKLFVTGTGQDAGQEERFPGPNNLSKMRRSVENAEHVGLFLPSRGFRGRYLPPAQGALRERATTSSFNPQIITGNAHSSTTRLFPPRQGQVYRQEQRRRRSPYDRGVPTDEDEFDQASRDPQDPALSSPGPSFGPRRRPF